MKQYELIATTTFGLEAVCKRELIALGFKVIQTENGKVTFLGDKHGIVKANLWLRSADRVLLKLGEFKSSTFDELFDNTIILNWGDYIPVDGKFTVNGKTVKSKLTSLPAVQRTVKKAVVKSLMKFHKTTELVETRSEYSILIAILKDVATLTLDTSGSGLHKRGYRIKNVEAPMKETLAASLIMLSYWNKERVLYDVFCGSGTIPIEAALIGRNIAPGLNRQFISQDWDFIGSETWKEGKKLAYQEIDHDSKITIYASDISEESIEAAKINALEAGVDDCIEFTVSDFNDLGYKNDYGIVISNPPYGERLEDEYRVKKMTNRMGTIFNKLDTWSKYFISSFKNFEQAFYKNSDRKRKLYNGRIEAWYYQYYGPKPPLK
ncbi:class I SAM-dependent RNA methyltransferase [Candidatus Izimaplasma bacterium]|nr:class I SAM-dependent RNA methyltransferase [Candidatus Izimaplasma bacterium]